MPDRSLEHSWTTGITFGLTSATITTLGLMVGLHSFSGTKDVVLGGILTIAIADAFSDALGIHLSEESERIHTAKQIWVSTLATFLAKFLFALTFTIPVILFEISTAIYVAILWGLLAIVVLSFIISRSKRESSIKCICEHVLIVIIVVIAAHYIGDIIEAFFK